MKTHHLLLTAVLLLIPLGSMTAQQPQARPPQQARPAQPSQQATASHIVVRYFQCQRPDEAIRRFQEGDSIVRQMIREGKFLDYGLMRHDWGDEWNVVDYFVVANLDGFFTNFDEMIRRLNAANEARTPAAAAPGQQPEPRRPFNEICGAHKDNIYSIVQPPRAAASSP